MVVHDSFYLADMGVFQHYYYITTAILFKFKSPAIMYPKNSRNTLKLTHFVHHHFPNDTARLHKKSFIHCFPLLASLVYLSKTN